MFFVIVFSFLLLFSITLDPQRPEQWGLDDLGGVVKFPMAVLVIGVGLRYIEARYWIPNRTRLQIIPTRKRIQIPWFWATLGSYAAMVIFIILSFLAWLLLGISPWFATLAAIVLCSVTAITLSRHLLRAGQPSATGHTPES